MGCRYCGDTGLSDFSSADMTLAVCNVCPAGEKLQKILRLLVEAEEKQPEAVKEALTNLKRVIEL